MAFSTSSYLPVLFEFSAKKSSIFYEGKLFSLIYTQLVNKLVLFILLIPFVISV